MLLVFAARYGHTDCVTLLLKNGAKQNITDMAMRSPLHLASWFGHTEVVKALLNAGGDVDAVDYFGRTPLHCACWFGNRGVEMLLLERKANVNAQDHSQNTPLHFACARIHADIVADLLKAGADPKIKNELNRTPEQVAEIEDRGEILELLQKKEDKDAELGFLGVDKNLVHEQRQMNKMLDDMVNGQDKQAEMMRGLKQKLSKQHTMLAHLHNQGSEMRKQLQAIEALCDDIVRCTDAMAPREWSRNRFDISRVSTSQLTVPVSDAKI